MNSLWCHIIPLSRHVTIAPSVAIVLPLRHPSPLPLRHPWPLLLSCRRCTFHCHRCSNIHCWHHCRITITPSITIVAVAPLLTLSLSSVVIDSPPLMVHFLLVIIADLFKLIVVSINCTSIGGDGSIVVHVLPNWRWWQRCCHRCCCRGAPLLVAGGAITARQHCRLTSFWPYSDAQHSSSTHLEVAVTEVATDKNTKQWWKLLMSCEVCCISECQVCTR